MMCSQRESPLRNPMLICEHPTLLSPIATQPLSLGETKRHLYLSEVDASRDQEVQRLIQAAREQWEHDTGSITTTRQLSVSVSSLEGVAIRLPGRPLQSVESIEYYDRSNQWQIVDPSVYGVDVSSGTLVLSEGQAWPEVANRWDAILISYTAGVSQADVPAIAKQAMLLQVAYFFDGNRGDGDRPNDMRAYEALVRRFMRSNYP